MADNDDDKILNEAIAATQKERFAQVWGDDDPVLDETGDRSLEQLDDDLDSDDESEEADEKSAKSEEDKVDEKSDDKEKSDRDEKGRFVAKDKDEGKDEDADAKAEKSDAKSEKSEARDQEGRVPSARLREQTERATRAETERDALKTQIDTISGNAQKAIDALNARLDAVLAGVAKPVEKKTEPEPEIDLFENPKAFVESLNKTWETRLTTALQQRDQSFEQFRVQSSLEAAAARHKDVFAKAYEAVQKLDPKNPADLQLGRQIMQSPNPGESMVAWWKRNETLRVVGDDPAAYEDKLRKETRDALMKDPEFRKQLLADLRAEAEGANDGKPRTITKLPRSLNGASGGGSANDDTSALDQSDAGRFERLWSQSA